MLGCSAVCTQAHRAFICALQVAASELSCKSSALAHYFRNNHEGISGRCMQPSWTLLPITRLTLSCSEVLDSHGVNQSLYIKYCPVTLSTSILCEGPLSTAPI